MNETPPPIPEAKASMGEDVRMRILLPVGRSGYAIAAGYLGLFSILIAPAPLALLFGILGIRAIRRSREQSKRKHGMGRAVFGVVMGALGTIILIIGLIAGLTQNR